VEKNLKTVIASGSCRRLRRLAKGYAVEMFDGALDAWTLVVKVDGKAEALAAYSAEVRAVEAAAEAAEAARLEALLVRADASAKTPKAAPKADPAKTRAKKAGSAAAQWADAEKRSRLMAGFLARALCPVDHFRSDARKAKVDVIAPAILSRGEDAVKALLKGRVAATPAEVAALLG
jgi:hypothetical protein